MSEKIQQDMQKEEQLIIDLMLEQYYKYTSLLRMTNNFQKDIHAYSHLNLADYSGSIAIIGSISEIIQDKKENV